MTILQTLESNSRFHDVQFTRLDDVSEELMLVACEDGKGRIYKLPTEDSKETAYSAKLVAELLGHKNRQVFSKLETWVYRPSALQNQMS